jgi:hypothetical protein
MMKKNDFSPIAFLSSVGAGGIAVAPFAILQYTYHTGKGLITYNQIPHGTLSTFQEVLFRFMEAGMLLFAAIHLILSVFLFIRLSKWIKTDAYKNLLNNPLQNGSLLAPFVSIIMTMNVFIGPIRFFWPLMADNLQMLMAPALATWGIIITFLILKVIELLKISFVNEFDNNKIGFGWLMPPFALSMATVTGTGIAALSRNIDIANIAAFLSLIPGTMGIFLLFVKVVTIFKVHYQSKGMPDKQFLPSFLIVIPIVTLFAISGFRLVHFLEHHHHLHVGFLNFFIVVASFAFETWYLLFGLVMLKDYIRQDFFKKEYYFSQWALVCPFVAYAVLGSFMYKVFVPNVLLYGVIITSLSVAMFIHLKILRRHLICCLPSVKSPSYQCS